MMNSFTFEEAFGGPPPPVTKPPVKPVAKVPVDSGDGSFSFEEAFNQPEPVRQPRSEASIVLGGVAAGSQAIASEIATIGDMILNTPTSLVGLGANVLRRIGGMSQGEDRKLTAKEAHEVQARIEETAPNLLKKFVSVFASPDNAVQGANKTEKAMNALMSWSDTDAQAIEDRSKGVFKKEDVQLWRDTLLGSLGAKAMIAPTKALVDRAGKKKLEDPFSVPAEPPAIAPSEPVNYKAAIEQATGVAPPPTKQAIAQRRAQVRKAFEEDPGYADYTRNLVDENIRQDTNAATRDTRYQAAEGVLSPRTGSAEATILKPDGKPDTSWVGQRSLDTGLEKVVQGRSFDLTAAEKVAIRGNAKNWGNTIEKGAIDNDLLAVMGLAGVGTALAMAYPDEAKDLAAAAAGAGLFYSGSIRDLSKIPDAAPLSAVLKGSETTLKTLERLPQDNYVFKKTQIEEQLRRQDVTKAEKDVLQEVMKSVPGEQITAKQLVSGFKKETGNFELTRKESGEYADYGLENIGRDPWAKLLPERAGEAVPGMEAVDMAPSDVAAKTHIYALPEHMQMDTGNHFKDPNYFAHTRSFMEDGVRHVVEIQSDLAQRTGKPLAEGEWKALADEATRINTELVQDAKDLKRAKAEQDLDPSDIYDHERMMEGKRLRLNEIAIKMDAGAVNSQLAPILKNWEKRIVREELADARGAGESVVRFAVPDTVAKVEGWPDIQQAFDRSWGDRPPPGVTRPEVQFKPEHQGIYDRYERNVSKFLKQLGGREVTDALGHKWIEVPTEVGGQRTQMFGRVDQGLLKALGAAGAGSIVGAYLMGKEDVTGAVLGAAGGLLGRYAVSKSPRIRKGVEALAKGADYAGGLVSTRVQNISPALHHKLIEHERQVFRDGHQQLTQVAPFIEAIGKVKSDQVKALNSAILTNEPTAIRAAMAKAKVPGLATEWTNVRNLLDDIGKRHVDLGLLKKTREDYFPRIVKDVDGLLNHLGTEQRTILEKKIRQAEMQAKKSGVDLTPEERSAIINNELERTPVQGSGKSSFLKKRSLGAIPEEYLPYYETPVNSLTSYIRAATREQAKAKFFGHSAVKEDGVLNLDQSIGALVDRELTNKNISFKDVNELKGLIRSRFVGGEQASVGLLQDAKNIGYTSLLGHPTSALVQLSDVGQTIFTQGLMPTVEGAVQMLRGKGVSAKDFGLLDHVAEELSSTRGTAKLLNGVLKWVGFTAIDKFGKNNALTAAKIKNQRLAQTTKGQAAIRERFGEAFGPDTDALISDLKARKQTDLVDALLFHELSRQQPISKIEVPQAYLDNPNARAAYMLKTFMLKQMDLARRDAYNEIKKGNVVKGTKNLIGLGLLWGVSGAMNQWVRDWIMGKEVDPKADDIWENMFRTFGWSSYVFDKAKQGKPVQAALGTIAPPISIIDDTISTAQKMAGDKKMKPADYKGVQNIPVVGRLVYNRALGGAEDADRKRKLRERREARKRALKRRN